MSKKLLANEVCWSASQTRAHRSLFTLASRLAD